MLNLGLSLWFGLLENSRPPACYFQGNSWVLCYSIWIIGKSFKIFHTFNIKTPWNVRENSKKHSVDIIVGLTLCGESVPRVIWFFLSYLSWKKGHLVNIPKPRRCLGFKNLLLAGLFFNFGNFGKIKLHLEHFSLEFAQL